MDNYDNNSDLNFKSDVEINCGIPQLLNRTQIITDIMIKTLKKYHMAKEKVKRNLRKQAFIKYNILKESRKTQKMNFQKQFDRNSASYKALTKENLIFNKIIEIKCHPEGFPLESHHYVAIKNSFNPHFTNNYNLLNFVAFKELSRPLTNSEKIHLREKSKAFTAQSMIDIQMNHQISYLCSNIIKRCGSEFANKNILAKLIGKEPDFLTVIWLNLIKEEILNKNIKVEQRKVQPFRYCRLFCTICHLYLCNLHFKEEQEGTTSEHDDEFSSYITKIKCSSLKEESFQWETLYKCPQTEKKYCYMQQNNINMKEHKVKKFEQQFIFKYCLQYNIKNPCFIKLLLGTNMSCKEVYTIIQNYKNLKTSDPENHKSDIDKSNKNPKKSFKDKKAIFQDYLPCYHPGEKCDLKICLCAAIRGSCEKYCGCSKTCKYRFNGCNCLPGRCKEGFECYCIKNNRECDPDLCINCKCEMNTQLIKKKRLRIPYCPNTNVTYNYKPRILIGKSKICEGLGIFAGQLFKKNGFIGEYVGEILPVEHGFKREIVLEPIGMSYLFEINPSQVIKQKFY